LLRTKDYAEAARQCRRWLRLDPNAAWACNALGVSYFNRGEFGRARGAFARTVKLDPDHAQAHLYLAFTYGKLGNYRKAQRLLRTTIDRFPNSPAARAAQKYVQQPRRRR
jgi:TolA-binding protein